MKPYIIHCTTGLGGGVGTVIKNLIDEQKKKDYKIGLVYTDSADINTNEFGDEIELIKITNKNYKGRNLLFGLPLKKIYKREKKRNPNRKIIMHIHNPVVVGLLNNISGLPLICTIHGIITENKFLTRKITNMLLKKINYFNNTIVGVSKQTTLYYNNQINSSSIITVQNGVKVTQFKKKIDKNFTIGFTSYIDEHKGWKILFDAYMMLRPFYKNKLKIIFAGKGPLSEIEKLKKMIEENELQEEVIYLGYVPNAGENIIPFLNLAVLPSKSEGIPMAILEAIGHGIPVLATAVGGIPEVIIDGENGYLLEREAQAFAEKINTLYENQELYNHMQYNARLTFENQFTSEKMADQYLDLYEKINN